MGRAERALWRVAGNESHAGEFLKDAPQWNTAKLARAGGSNTNVFLKLDFALQKKGMAVPAVWRLIHLLAFIEPKQAPYAHRRDACAPLQ